MATRCESLILGSFPGMDHAQTDTARSEAHGDAHGGVLFRRAELIAVSGGHGNELGQFSRRWLPGVGPGDFLEESPKSSGGDDELDRRLVGNVSMGVRDARRYVHGVACVDFSPL